MHFVKSVEHVAGYKLRLGFDDGSVRLVDMEPLLDGEMFAPLKDMRKFRSVRVHPELDTIVWNNGADVCPDLLYEIGVPVADHEDEYPVKQSDSANRVCVVAEAKAAYRTKKKK